MNNRLRSRDMLCRAIVNLSVNDNCVMAPAHSDRASDRLDIGSMTNVCSHCSARFWVGETIECCFKGSLIIDEVDIPESLSNVILSTAVQKDLRSYNMAMAMASVGHKKEYGLPDGVFTLSGRSYHAIGTMEPAEGRAPNFAQIYLIDTEMATNRRSEIFGDRLNREVLSTLHSELLRYNPYVSEFCRAAAADVAELIWSTEDNIMGMHIGALTTSTGGKRSIVIRRRGDDQDPVNPNCLHFIDDGHPLYHTLAYPLLFPTGGRGWFHGMVRDATDFCSTTAVSLHDYGRYILMHRQRPTHLQKCRQLALEFYCDMWAQNESRRASFHLLPSQQSKYRMGRKCAVEDQLHASGNLTDISMPVVLPSSFVGSAKWYHMLYLDALTLPQRYCCPS